MTTRPLLAALLFAGLSLPAFAEEAAKPDAPQTPAPSEPRPIRNAPSPRALEFAAYIFSAANVCGYRIGVKDFEALLAKQNVLCGWLPHCKWRIELLARWSGAVLCPAC